MEGLQLPLAAIWEPSTKCGDNKMVLKDPYGNSLIKKSEYGDKSFYRCGRKDIKCPVRVTLNKKEDMIVRIKNEHNHDSGKVLQFIKNARKTAVMNASSNPTIAPRTAYRDLINTVMSSPSTSAGVGLLPKPRTLAKQIHRNRKAQLGVLGNLPREWEEYVVPEMYRVTGSNQPFLILDETLDSGEKI